VGHDLAGSDEPFRESSSKTTKDAFRGSGEGEESWIAETMPLGYFNAQMWLPIVLRVCQRWNRSTGEYGVIRNSFDLSKGLSQVSTGN